MSWARCDWDLDCVESVVETASVRGVVQTEQPVERAPFWKGALSPSWLVEEPVIVI